MSCIRYNTWKDSVSTCRMNSGWKSISGFLLEACPTISRNVETQHLTSGKNGIYILRRLKIALCLLFFRKWLTATLPYQP